MEVVIRCHGAGQDLVCPTPIMADALLRLLGHKVVVLAKRQLLKDGQVHETFRRVASNTPSQLIELDAYSAMYTSARQFIGAIESAPAHHGTLARPQRLPSPRVPSTRDPARPSGQPARNGHGPAPLAAYIPAPNPHFIRRPILWRRLASAFAARIVACLIGETGTGKTEAVRELAAQHRLPFLLVSGGPHLDVRWWVGKDQFRPGTGTFFAEGPLARFLQAPSIILFDEINALDARKAFDLHELFNERQLFVRDADAGRGRLYTVHPDCRLFAAMNPPKRAVYTGVEQVNLALGNRLAAIHCAPFTRAEIAQLVQRAGVKPDVAAPLVQLYEEGRALITAQGFRYELSVRNILHFVTLHRTTTVYDALAMAVIDPALLTAGETAWGALQGLATAIFGAWME